MTCPRGYRFQALSQLVNFDRQATQGQRVSTVNTLLLNQRPQLGMAIEGRPTQPSAGGDRGEGDVLARPDKIQANLLDAEHLVACGHDA
jgi:hypothetical protein